MSELPPDSSRSLEHGLLDEEARLAPPDDGGWNEPGVDPFAALDSPREPMDSDVKTNPYASTGFDPNVPEALASSLHEPPSEAGLGAVLQADAPAARPAPPRRRQQSEPDANPFLAPPAAHEPPPDSSTSNPFLAGAAPSSATSSSGVQSSAGLSSAGLSSPSASNPFTVDFASRPQQPAPAPASSAGAPSSVRRAEAPGSAAAPLVGRPGVASPDVRDPHATFRKGSAWKSLLLVAGVFLGVAALVYINQVEDRPAAPTLSTAAKKSDSEQAVIGRTLPPYRTTLEEDSSENHREAFRKSEQRARAHEQGEPETRPSGVPSESQFKDAFKNAAK